MRQVYPAVVGKVEVKELKNKESSSGAEANLGMRFGQPIGVIELKEPAPHPQHGMPHYYLVIHDAEVIEHYRDDQARGLRMETQLIRRTDCLS